MWKGLYNAGLLSGSGMGCYANGIAALVSMINFIIFITVALQREDLSDFTGRIIIRLCIQQEKHRRIMASRQSFNETFIMPIGEKDNMAGG